MQDKMVDDIDACNMHCNTNKDWETNIDFIYINEVKNHFKYVKEKGESNDQSSR